MRNAYTEDLAYIHDAGFSGFVLEAAPALLGRLRRAGIGDGLVVDLGCGSGRWAGILSDGGYDVFGVDISPAMIRLARRHAPSARFQVGSILRAALPPCRAVTAIGEVVNYLFDARNSRAELGRLFRRVFAALPPGGLFLFDAAGPGRTQGTPVRTFVEGRDWSLLLEKSEDAAHRTLTRRIVIFRKLGGRYRRSEEIHRLNLYPPSVIAAELRTAGFRVQMRRGFGRSQLGAGLAAFVARKPAR